VYQRRINAAFGILLEKVEKLMREEKKKSQQGD